MMYSLTKAKMVNQIAKKALEEFLENLYEEAMEVQDEERELLLLSAYFVGCEAVAKETFMVIENLDLPKKHIIVPGIPYEISQAWAF